MVTDSLAHLAYPLRAARRAVLPVALIALAGYFALNVVYSERGYLSLQRKRVEVNQAEVDLAVLREERKALELKVNLLKGHAVGRDLLEEEARRVLNVAHPDDVVVRMVPELPVLSAPPDSGDPSGGSRNSQ
jgi:cell division protein FtsB